MQSIFRLFSDAFNSNLRTYFFTKLEGISYSHRDLYHGRPTTPPELMPFSWSEQQQTDPTNPSEVGESRRFLETMLFKGTLEIFDSPQVCLTNTLRRLKVTVYFFGLKRMDCKQRRSCSKDHNAARAREQPIRFQISSSDLRLVPNNPNILAQAVWV